ncbi:lipid-binding SYLF domain-containing protein [Asticcacaulis machinosus]|uniref:Lipid-binding SYLF domain-containing protein n=1 Tax=Asticcacaulis machinosus TaxID=2984211 RepID=A0ABT5HMD0_9CAUL|nr:lipid-binding SYLF domain-containing protein [Asticcacaulis machinosus]MDC7677306.1 lipid-binding SYLF domain-containing protein [Asticcacaulis machinosus]
MTKTAVMTAPKKTLMSLVMALSLTTAVAAPALISAPAEAATKGELTVEANQALNSLYASNPTAKLIGSKAKAVLIFPNIVKAGLVFGGAYGEGVLMHSGKADAYYNSFSGSWGLQAGAQSYGYAVFLMNDKAVKYIHDTQGWEIGVGPTVVIVDEGVAKNLSTSTLKDDAYAFTFNQQGLMAGVTIDGTKISKIKE